MTTSYPTEQNAPTENAGGEQVWKPSVGVVFEPAADKAQSYGGIIGALQDEIRSQGGAPKAYPQNFAGIIAAIQDLRSIEEQIPVYPGDIPPGSEIDNDGNLVILQEPRDGTLWFDTRQGRLFVALDKQWWQTNGADGLAFIRENSQAPITEEIVPGQFWYSTDDQALFVFDGESWVLVTSNAEAGTFQTTATLPLADSGVRSNTTPTGNIITEPDLSDFNTQRDFNQWAYAALIELEDEVDAYQPVHVGLTEPSNPKPGALWYDTEGLELSIWYEDDNSGQWVPTATSFRYDADLDVLKTSIETEKNSRIADVNQLHLLINQIDAADQDEVNLLKSKLEELRTDVDAKATISSLIDYASSTFVNDSIAAARNELQWQIQAVSQSIPSLATYVTEAELDEDVQVLHNQIALKTSISDVQSYVAPLLANLDNNLQSFVQQSLTNLSQNYLTHAGGTLTGNLVINKLDLADPALDFSSTQHAASPAFKFNTLSADNLTAHYPTFGTTINRNELAWKFDGDEDFCWIYNDNSRVFSITKDGPACSTLVLGDIGQTNANGRVIHNKIDVKERLNAYKTTFEAVRSAVSSATDFESLRANILSALASI